MEARRAMTGGWWARDFKNLTKECLRFLLKDPNASLTLYDSDRERKKDFVIPIVELRRLENRLKSS
jgi:hypothetical protein